MVVVFSVAAGGGESTAQQAEDGAGRAADTPPAHRTQQPRQPGNHSNKPLFNHKNIYFARKMPFLHIWGMWKLR